MRLGFNASDDPGSGSIVEAAVDAVSIRFVTCNESPPLTAQAKKLLDGVQAGGTLVDTHASDDVYWQLDPTPTANPAKQKVESILLTTSPLASPGSLRLRVEAHQQGGPSGDVIQELKLLNYQTQQFETIDVRTASTSDTVVDIAAGGNPARFVQPGTREMTAIVRWHSPEFSGAPFFWSIGLDEAVWLVQ
jgi:hypothetical protein